MVPGAAPIQLELVVLSAEFQAGGYGDGGA